MQPATAAFHHHLGHAVVADIENAPAIAAHCVEKTACDQGAVGFRPAQTILMLFHIVFGGLGRVVQAVPAESCGMGAKHRFAVTARAGMNEQAKTILVQAESGKRRCVRYALDALKFGKMIAASNGAKRTIFALSLDLIAGEPARCVSVPR